MSNNPGMNCGAWSPETRKAEAERSTYESVYAYDTQLMARDQADALRGRGFRARVYPRDVKVEGLRVNLWVVVVRYPQ